MQKGSKAMGRQPFVYRPRTVEDAARRKQETSSDTPNVILDGFKVYQSRKGENWIRILPATWEDAHHYGYDVWVHYNIGPDRNAVLCLNRMAKQPCPVCEQRLLAERAGDEDEAKELRPRRRVAVWMIDRQAEQEGPQIWPMPITLDEDIQNISTDKTDGTYYLIDAPDEGYDIMFEKTGQGIGTKYISPQVARKPSSVNPAYLDYINDNPIPNCLLWRPYEDIMNLFGAGGVARGPSGAAPQGGGTAAREAAFGRRPMPGAQAAPAAAGPQPPPRQAPGAPAQQWQNPRPPQQAPGQPPGGYARPGMPPSGPPQSPPPRRPMPAPQQGGYAPPPQQAQQWEQPQQEQYDPDPNGVPWDQNAAPPPNGPADYGFDPANAANEYGEPQQQQEYAQPQQQYAPSPQQQYAQPPQQGGYMPQPPPRQPPQGQLPMRGGAPGGGFQPPRPTGPQGGMQQRSPAEVAAQLRPRMPQR
jgi:hypothetical protein